MTDSAQSRLLARQPRRRGVVTVLAAFLIIALLAMVAFSVDIGYLLSTQEELQRTADAAVLAACWEYGKGLADGLTPSECETKARATATAIASKNEVSRGAPSIDPNYGNLPSGDLRVGYVEAPLAANLSFDSSDPSNYNAIHLAVRRSEALNGEAPLFFGRLLGRTSQSMKAEATAVFVRDVSGFRPPTNGGTLRILPIALDLSTYDAWQLGNVGRDSWAWDPLRQEVTRGSDNLLEVNLFSQTSHSSTGAHGRASRSAANRGAVNIGRNNNSTRTFSRQITEGISANDLSYHGGELRFNSQGELYLSGNTGVSAGIKDELTGIIGQPRVIPIFSDVSGVGNNTIYTIVKWAGVRITYVHLTGPMHSKRIMVQPAPVLTDGVIPSTTPGSSSYVYSPVFLVR